MKINTEKKKMICVTVAKNALVNSYINTGPHDQICGAGKLKMLGFVFGRRPNADEHVKHMAAFTLKCGHFVTCCRLAWNAKMSQKSIVPISVLS